MIEIWAMGELLELGGKKEVGAAALALFQRYALREGIITKDSVSQLWWG